MARAKELKGGAGRDELKKPKKAKQKTPTKITKVKQQKNKKPTKEAAKKTKINLVVKKQQQQQRQRKSANRKKLDAIDTGEKELRQARNNLKVKLNRINNAKRMILHREKDKFSILAQLLAKEEEGDAGKPAPPPPVYKVDTDGEDKCDEDEMTENFKEEEEEEEETEVEESDDDDVFIVDEDEGPSDFSTPRAPAASASSSPSVTEILNPFHANASEFDRSVGTPEAQNNIRNTIAASSSAVVKKYIGLYDTVEGRKMLDTTALGVRVDGSKFVIGNSRLEFKNSRVVIDGRDSFAATDGLMQLLLLKAPASNSYTQLDLKNYKDILMKSKAPYRKYSVEQPINASRSVKYKEVIKKLFNTGSTGTGLTKRKPRGAPRIVYKFYSKPSALVQRLKLLIADSRAGNDSHVDEIGNIVDELRKQSIIL